MLIDSVIIKLIHNGIGVNPDYSLIIYGHGSLEYYGNENVKVKGKIDETLDKEKIINLLSEFKKSGFFSLNDTYSVDESLGRSFTTISISVPGKDGMMKTKTIIHYQDDRNVPVELKNLEDKIDEIAGSEKWIGKPSEVIVDPLPEPKIETQEIEIKAQKLEKPKEEKTFPVKLIMVIVAVIVAVIIVLFLIVFAMTSGIFDSSNDNTNEGGPSSVAVMSFESLGNIDPFTISFTGSGKYFDGDVVYNWDFGDGTTSTKPNPTHTYPMAGAYTVVLTVVDANNVRRNCSETLTVDYFPPYFTFLTPTTASIRVDGNRSLKTTEFQQGDIVYIDYEFNNVTHNISYNICYDFTVEISVKSEGIEYDQYIKPFKNNSYVGGGLFYVITDFQTSDKWPTGEYEAVLKISDNISKKQIIGFTSFLLYDKDSPIPTATLFADPASGNANLTVYFEGIGKNFTGPLTYEWDFDNSDGLQIDSTDQNPTYTYTDAGIYTVTLNVTDSIGIYAIPTIQIEVFEEDISDPLIASIEDPEINEDEYTFTGTASGGTGDYYYEWDFNYVDEIFTVDATGQIVTHTFSEKGIIRIRLRVYDSKIPESNIAFDDEFVYIP